MEYKSITQVDLDFLGEMIELLEENNNEAQMISIHDRLKLFEPAGISSVDCTVIWDKAWKSCPMELRLEPDREAIRKYDMLFCKMLMKKLQY